MEDSQEKLTEHQEDNLDAQEVLAAIDWTKAAEVKCKKCECPLFKSRFGIRAISKEHSPTPTEMIVPIRLFVCENCNYVDPDLQVMIPTEGK